MLLEIKTANIFICLGQVYPVYYAKTVISGTTVRLTWTFLSDPSDANLAWYFTRRRVGSIPEPIAIKNSSHPVQISQSSLPGVEIELTPPIATLVLKNVDESYNGKYRFSVQGVGGRNVYVELYIAGMF